VSAGLQANATALQQIQRIATVGGGWNGLRRRNLPGQTGQASALRFGRRNICVRAPDTCLKALGVYYNNSWRRIALSRRYDKIDPTVGVHQLSVASAPACITP